MITDKINLNDEQLKAVTHKEGPLLIVAGAGTGKTTVITQRIYWLIKEKNINPHKILALTFTEKAAYEMEERVDRQMPYGYTQMWILTFHAFCERVLKDEGLYLGLDPDFNILTQAESIALFRKFLFDLSLVHFRPRANPRKFISSLLTHYSRLKDEDITADEYYEWAKKLLQKSTTTEDKEQANQYLELAQSVKKYDEIKEKEGVMDFADLISNTLKLLRTKKNILEKYREKFSFILVDEFQDTNIAQYELIKLLSPPQNNPNLTVVGDDNQSIYKFRGAAISNILHFQKDYPNSQMIVLNKNYRSTQVILDSAYKLIKHNDPDTLEAKLGISKKLVSARNKKGREIEFLYGNSVDDEVGKVADKILELKKDNKYQYPDFAVLVRANKHSEAFQKVFEQKGIPYQFLGPGILFKKKEIKDLLAYLKLLSDPENTQAFYHLLLMEPFNIKGRDFVSLANFARRNNLPLYRAVERLVESWTKAEIKISYPPFILKETEDSLLKVINLLHSHLDSVPHKSAGEILYAFLKSTGQLEKLAHAQTVEEEKKVLNITKFFQILRERELTSDDNKVPQVIEWLELLEEVGESPTASQVDLTENDAVNILTVHGSKGLEFKIVFLVNLVNNRFPSRDLSEKIPIPEELIKEDLPEGDYHEEEERRLFYVGLTRAKDLLFLSAAAYYGEGKRKTKISPFVIETMGVDAVNIKPAQTQVKQLPLFYPEPIGTVSSSLPSHRVEYLSYSMMQTFKICPLHYKLRYIFKLPSPPTPATSFGTSVHGALRDFYKQIRNGAKANSQLLLTSLENNWIIEGYTNKKHELENFAVAQKYLQDYFRVGYQPQKLPLALEIPFNFQVLERLKIGGRIDRVDRLADGSIEIIDYKTSQKIPTQEEVDRDNQLSLYALAATQVQAEPFGVSPDKIKLSLYFFLNQTKITTTRSTKDITEAKELILKTKEEIENSQFPCSHSILCRQCEYKFFCSSQ